MPTQFFDDPNPFLGSAAQILLAKEHYKALSILAEGAIELNKTGEESDSRSTNTGWHYNVNVSEYSLTISIDLAVYGQIASERDVIERQISDAINESLHGEDLVFDDGEKMFNQVVIKIEHKTDPDWQIKAKATLSGAGLTNQGRVRSDSIAPIVHQGLLFRSPPETRLFDALKRANILFAPLPVFVKSSAGNRIEPDFVVIDEGVTLLIEVDGSTYHTETPLAAQERLEEFTNAGVQHLRLSASDCNTDAGADSAVQRIKEKLERIRRIR